MIITEKRTKEILHGLLSERKSIDEKINLVIEVAASQSGEKPENLKIDKNFNLTENE